MYNYETEEEIKARILIDNRIKAIALNTNEGAHINSKVKFEISKVTVRLDTGFVLNVNGLEYHVLETKDITSSDNSTVVVASSVGQNKSYWTQY